ncbi:hypothetical protein QQS21_008638 [Conoideocrella luteorostrata]|uniref:Heterokaryon incompatibility domain-containing protein n=1 Tax=Conoideocrella luteorostrata TaxID=1105319 RepID=A0AAJ0FVU2_9HYPO|nr:hypothetical protein QQS21_008638 [Conoideocrella luteorostrata]
MSDGSTFRVVYLLPGAEDDRLECTFLEVPVSAKPNYSALSYVWGAPSTAELVWINGRVIGITQNLGLALRHLGSPAEVRSFWIDALCINQTDEVGEKVVQIPLMRRIYQHAPTVVIFLGGDSDHSETVPSICKIINQAYERSDFQLHQYPFTQQPLNGDKYKDLSLPEMNSTKWQGFRRLLQRPWFTRIWVIQEAVMATSAEVICGAWTMDWTFFFQSISRARVLGLPIFNDPDGKIEGDDTVDPSVSASQIILLNALRAGESEFVPWKLIDLLHRGRSSLATRPHDYCYGLMGLSEEFDDPVFKIDYELPVEDLYRKLAQYFVEHGDGVKMLYNASGSDLKLPSWVPDWSYRSLPRPRIAPHPQTIPDRNPSCSAASSFVSFIQLHPSLPDVIVVRGLIFDLISNLGINHGPRYSKDRREVFQQPTKLNGKVESLSGSASSASHHSHVANKSTYKSSILHIADCITELYQLLRSGQNSTYPTGEVEEDVVWKTLICNNTLNSMKKASSDYAVFYQCLITVILAHNRSWKVPQLNPGPLSFKELAGYGPSDVAGKSDVFVTGSIEFCNTKRRGRTRRGFVGQFPLKSQIGDMIFLPLGSAIPFLIRQATPGVYRIIGECYLHGIMEGEAFDDKRTPINDVLIA